MKKQYQEPQCEEINIRARESILQVQTTSPTDPIPIGEGEPDD